MKAPYDIECRRIEEDSTYTAEAHHLLAKRQLFWYKASQMLPAVITAGIVTAIASYPLPTWVSILALVSAVVTAIASVLNPQKGYYDHLSAAKAFTVMKHDARELGELARSGTTDVVLSAKCLHDRYNDLVRTAPMTEDWAFEKARKRIQDGVHESDAKA